MFPNLLNDLCIVTFTAKRHLYLVPKSEAVEVNAVELIRRCQVVNFFSLPAYWENNINAYLDVSPYNFYVKWRFPALKVTSWTTGKKLKSSSKVPEICVICFHEDKKRAEGLTEFKRVKARRQLRAFDPFGGVGAFALAMQEAGCLKLTHAVELSPSAALTLKYAPAAYYGCDALTVHPRRNSPETVVYNQCANRILEHAVKTVRIQGYNLPRDYRPILQNDPTLSPLPPPPTPGDIDCIVAGFPWYVPSTTRPSVSNREMSVAQSTSLPDEHVPEGR